MESSNIFSMLYAYRPRDNITPGENYLTQSFAYVLRTDQVALQDFLKKVIPEVVAGDEVEDIRIDTQVYDAGHLSGSHSYFDMVIKGACSSGSFYVLCEHKWGSRVAENQIKKYLDYLKHVAKDGTTTRLVFIVDSVASRGKAMDKGAELALLWSDIYKLLGETPDQPDPTSSRYDFAAFLSLQGLRSSGPLSVENMAAYVFSHHLPRIMHEVCDELLNSSFEIEVPCDFFTLIPKTRNEPSLGRVVFQYQHNRWDPGLSMGFLYSGEDLKLELVDADRGLDLMFRIECLPKDRPVYKLPRTLEALQRVKERFQAAYQEAPTPRVLVLSDSTNKNDYTLLLVRICVADVIPVTDKREDQVKAISTCLKEWCRIVFNEGDGLLEALKLEFGNASAEA